MINPYNQRQMDMMLDRINWYEKGEISLKRLVNDLEALFNVLENKDKNFEEKFFSYWAPLEIIYSFMVCEKRKSLDEKDTNDVNSALKKLKKLIGSYYD